MDKEKESLKKEKYEPIIKTPLVSIYQKKNCDKTKKNCDKTLIINKKEITFQKIKEGKILKRKRPL